MSRGLRQKERWRLGEVPGWAPGGPGAVMGGAFSETWPLVGGGCYLPGMWRAPVPAGRWVIRGAGTPRRRRGVARPWGNCTLFVNWTRAGQGDL